MNTRGKNEKKCEECDGLGYYGPYHDERMHGVQCRVCKGARVVKKKHVLKKSRSVKPREINLRTTNGALAGASCVLNHDGSKKISVFAMTRVSASEALRFSKWLAKASKWAAFNI